MSIKKRTVTLVWDVPKDMKMLQIAGLIHYVISFAADGADKNQVPNISIFLVPKIYPYPPPPPKTYFLVYTPPPFPHPSGNSDLGLVHTFLSLFPAGNTLIAFL